MKRRHLNPYLTAGLVITVLMIAITVIGIFWTPYAPTAMKYGRFQPPSWQHLFGTDNFGRDIFSRVLTGTGTTLAIALSTVSIGAIVGTLVGAVTGYFGGWVDEALMRLNDALTAFPSFLLALLIVSLVGPGKKYSVVLALGLVFIPSFARVVRTQFAVCRSQNYISSAKLMGVSGLRILFFHILPNTFSVLLPSVTIGFNNAVLAEASMSFLGIGIQPPQASLGSMLKDSQTYLKSAPWYALGTGLAVVLLVLAFSLLSEGIQQGSRRQ